MIGVNIPFRDKSIIENLKNIIKYKGNFIQIFASKTKSSYLSNDEINDYISLSKDIIKFNKKNNTFIVIHAPYTFNIADDNTTSFHHLRNLVNNLYVCHIIKAIGVVVHSGKYTNSNISDSINYMYRAIKYLIKIIIKNKWDVKILFELGSGEGKDIIITNNTLTDFTSFYNKFSSKYKKYFKLCIDTCHIFAAGYDIRKKRNVNKLLNEIKTDIGIENLGLIHFNDSYYDINTLKDRHSNIGEGYIGKDSLMYLIKKFKKYNIPILLETKDDYKTMMEEITFLL